MKPTIKLKILDWWRGETFFENFFVKILSKKYNVIEDENPDYILYSVFGYEHTKYDCIRIFFTGENICPDFNVCDYAIGFNHITFEDRYIRYPLYLLGEKDMERVVKKHIFTDDILEDKTKFCNYIYSHSNSSKLREDFFDLLSDTYKKVDSAGIYRNNIGGPLPIVNGDFSSSKYEFMKKYKFTIAFENSSTNGYTTEKITQAFGARTIPIYWGDSTISNTSGGGALNDKSFINVHSFKSLDEVVQKVAEIDGNDELFLKMLREPVFPDPLYPIRQYNLLVDFLDNIFSQDISKANRRKNEHWFRNYNQAYLQMTSMLILRLKVSFIKQKILQITYHQNPVFVFLRKIGFTRWCKKMLGIKVKDHS